MSAEPTPMLVLLTKDPPRLGLDNTYTLWNYRQSMRGVPPPPAVRQEKEVKQDEPHV